MPVQSIAGDPVVSNVTVSCQENSCRFDVTVKHEDEGWEHYADALLVLSEDEKLLGSRPLRHPHVGETEFTRSVQVLIPDDVTHVIIKANDVKHGLGKTGFVVEIPTK